MKETSGNVIIKNEVYIKEELIIKDEPEDSPTYRDKDDTKIKIEDLDQIPVISQFKHLNMKNARKIFQCAHCMDTYSNKKYLIKHIKENHDNNSKTIDKTLAPKEWFKCELCSYECYYKYELSRHMPVHTNKKPFKCNFCDYAGKTRRYLKIHMITHTDLNGLPVYNCGYCSFSHNKKYIVANHELRHKDANAASLKTCQMCDFKTMYQRVLTLHLKIHVKPPFDCETCSFSSFEKNLMKKHKLRNKH